MKMIMGSGSEFWLKCPARADVATSPVRTVRATGNHSFNFWILHLQTHRPPDTHHQPTHQITQKTERMTTALFIIASAKIICYVIIFHALKTEHEPQ